jgi:CDP-paratose 2-epimerase
VSGRVLITGGAGFIGANLAVALAERDWEVVALDSLHRRGSELNLPRLRDAGVRFAHGDVRALEDLREIGPVDAIVDCSAEPSVVAGSDGRADFVVRTNLVGGYHCLELARRNGAFLVFLSTSRVYPIVTLEGLRYAEVDTRFELLDGQATPGASAIGIAESFPLAGHRTLYGATKLATELLIEEYRASHGLQAVINRCGVIAGPWQMGGVEQGVFAHWMLSHVLGRPLRYIGYGGSGKQVRDLLHIDDLVELVHQQLGAPDAWDGAILNVGGGRNCSLSLQEATALCRQLTGNEVPVHPTPAPRPGDVRAYLSDCSLLFSKTSWRPRRTPRDVLEDIRAWVEGNGHALTATL